ncbi:DUF4349 domain-containing protein [Spirosoma sp. KCTC 42546]|uniref:DUF4349 domain-containing protein n=1 Tax=Spirosoma sp. KCTC 42546 TaxID=2520506 RepID=UPI00115AE581|nr:DUF4349 domain-containing protein [Spirosoma sp. KCTC 42546]QDK80010.1 DUF4349 domain-containing protein [Spirosoma sp. KCTC 42546]
MQISLGAHLKGMNYFLTLIVLLTVTGCQSKQESEQALAEINLTPRSMAALKAPSPEQDQASPDQEQMPESPTASPTQPSIGINRKIIRNAQVRIRVSDFTKSGQAIEQVVRQSGGQITSSNETKTGNSIENALVIRVPASRLDALLALLLKESIFTDMKTITSEDVTRRYVDVEARIRSKKAVEETYLKLLKQARSVADVLKVEEQLGKLREEREVQEAELRQLKDEVALSTINLSYYQQTEVALNPEEPFYTQIWHNFTDGFRLMGDVLVGVFYFLPIGIVGIGVVWLFLRWRRKRRSKV